MLLKMKNSLFVTIVAGVSVFVIGQFILKLVLDPVVEFKKALGELSAFFLREQASITNAMATEDTANEIGRLSSSLLSLREAIPFYTLSRFIFFLPSHASIEESCKNLNWIAYSVVKDAPRIPPGGNRAIDIYKKMAEISKMLKVRISYEII